MSSNSELFCFCLLCLYTVQESATDLRIICTFLGSLILGVFLLFPDTLAAPNQTLEQGGHSARKLLPQGPVENREAPARRAWVWLQGGSSLLCPRTYVSGLISSVRVRVHVCACVRMQPGCILDYHS